MQRINLAKLGARSLSAACAVFIVLMGFVCELEAQGTRPQLVRPVGSHIYELVVNERGIETKQTRTQFRLRTVAGEEEWVELLGAWQAPVGGQETAITLSDECRRAFDGAADRIGRVRLLPLGWDLTTIAPACVPEQLFGALTDIITFLLVQVPGHHSIEKIAAAGDSAGVAPFKTTWSRPPLLLAARFASPGGHIKLERLHNGRCFVQWSPGTARLDLLRQMNAQTVGWLTGVERMTLELEVDATNGTLLSGRAIVDELEMDLHMNYAGRQLPGLNAATPAGGFPLRLTRTLELKQLP